LSTTDKKLNIFTLSGLIIGPILGSGVILLPPLLFNLVGNYSLYIWIAISVLGFIFALIFGKLSILYPGEGGVSLATKNHLGKKYQLLTSFYLICAVLFGPVAVLLTAAQFLQIYFHNTSIALIALYLYIPTYILLLSNINFIAKIMLLLTSLITVIFIVASINILINTNNFIFALPLFNFKDIGYSFLLVFWAIVGWEVIGNYSNDAKSSKTITSSVIFSAIIVSLVYILISLAITFGDFNLKTTNNFQLVWILDPIFGNFSNLLLTVMTIILCIGTIILFVGGVARLVASLKLTKFTSIHLKNNSPFGAITSLASFHLFVLILVFYEVLNTADLVAFADGFFIANALIGLFTAIIIFENGFLKYSSYILSFLFFLILLTSNIYILFTILVLFLYTYFKKNTNI